MGHYIIKALPGPHWPNMVNGFGGRCEGGGEAGGGGIRERGGGGMGGGGKLTRLQEHHLEKYKSNFIVLILSERRLWLPPNDAHTSTSSSQYLSVFCFLLEVKGSPLQS